MAERGKPVKMKPKTPPPPRVNPCHCRGLGGINCSCAQTGVRTDWIKDKDLKKIKEDKDKK